MPAVPSARAAPGPAGIAAMTHAPSTPKPAASHRADAERRWDGRAAVVHDQLKLRPRRDRVVRTWPVRPACVGRMTLAWDRSAPAHVRDLQHAAPRAASARTVMDAPNDPPTNRQRPVGVRARIALDRLGGTVGAGGDEGGLRDPWPARGPCGSGEIRVAGARLQALLSLLLINRNEVLASDRILDEAMAGSAADESWAALQTRIAALRRAIGPDRITTREPGYVLRVEADELDADRFERLIAHGRDHREPAICRRVPCRSPTPCDSGAAIR